MISWFLQAQVFNERSLKPLSANPTKWPNTLKQFVGICRRIARVCFNILWDWCLKD